MDPFLLSKIPVLKTKRVDDGAHLVGYLLSRPLSYIMASTFYQLVILTDLEGDYINIYDTASLINCMTVPEFIAQGILSAIFLVTWHWFMFLMTVPLTCYHARLFLKQRHLIDVTDALRFPAAEKKFQLIKFGFYLVVFAMITFRLALCVFNFLSDGEYDFYLFQLSNG